MIMMPHWPIYIGPEKFSSDSLFRTKLILNALGNPELKIKNVFHITGTKGKGSTALFIENILKESGYKVNIYTSPHIYECNERIKINGEKISDEYLIKLTERIREICNKIDIQPSSFESLTLTGILAFSENKADANIFEVGMGGQFDATNVFENNPPICSIFTPIHLDHQVHLGKTIEEITLTKSHIAKKNQHSCIISSQSQKCLSILLPLLKKMNIINTYTYGKDFEIFKIEEDNNLLGFSSKKFGNLLFSKPSLEGEHQFINAGTAIMAILANIEKFSNINEKNISLGIQKTYNIARLERIMSKKILTQLPKDSIFYVDGAHNQLAAFVLMNFIEDFKKKNPDFSIIIIIARTKKSDSKSFLLPFCNKIIDLIICSRANLESLPEPPENLAEICKEYKIIHEISYNMLETINIIKKINKKSLIIATGSLYIARDNHLLE